MRLGIRLTYQRDDGTGGVRALKMTVDLSPEEWNAIRTAIREAAKKPEASALLRDAARRMGITPVDIGL